MTDPEMADATSVSYTHLRAHETTLHLVCRLLLEKNYRRQIEDANGRKMSALRLLYTSPSPRDYAASRMPSSA
ncbi:hypothetical protein JMUB7522_27270 [Staphylococcus aureus]